MTSPVEAVDRLCSRLAAELPSGQALDDIRAIEAKLNGPLLVAIGGQVSAGKSTLLNALIGKKVAPVHAGECTKAIYWYQYGNEPRMEVIPHDGDPVVRPLTNEQVPSDLGVALNRIDRVVIELPVPSLKEMVLIDTPGLNTQNKTNSARSLNLLGADNERAVARADVLAYLMPSAPGDFDKRILEAFRSAFPGSTLSALNTVGVLSKVDTLDGGKQPWVEVPRIVTTYQDRLRAVVGRVAPVIGLLAETVTCELVDDRVYDDLLRIGQHEKWRIMSMAVGTFDSDNGCDVPPERRRELLGLLGMYGARQAVEWTRSGEIASTGDLIDRLRRESGIDDIVDLFRTSLTERSDILKAGTALAQLRRVYWQHHKDHPALADLRSRIEEVEYEPSMHQLSELRAMGDLAGGASSLEPEELEEVDRLFSASSPTERLGLPRGSDDEKIRRRAIEREGYWNGREQMALIAERSLPRTIKLSYALLREGLAS